jgi:hypothetical protein
LATSGLWSTKTWIFEKEAGPEKLPPWSNIATRASEYINFGVYPSLKGVGMQSITNVSYKKFTHFGQTVDDILTN